MVVFFTSIMLVVSIVIIVVVSVVVAFILAVLVVVLVACLPSAEVVEFIIHPFFEVLHLVFVLL